MSGKPNTIYELIDQIYMEERMDEAEMLDDYDNPWDYYCPKCLMPLDGHPENCNEHPTLVK